MNDIFFNESSFVKEGDKLFSVLSTTSIGEIILSAPFDGYVGITDFKIGDKLKNCDILPDDMTKRKHTCIFRKNFPKSRDLLNIKQF